MKMVMIAALAAAQLLAASPARAEEPAAQQRETGATGQARFAEGVETGSADGQAAGLQVGGEAAAAAPQEDKPRKRKSTGDKVLTGAAVILGVGALAVGGLLVAIFVQ